MYVARTLEAALTEALKHYPVVVVTGPRQSGKTTLLRTVFPEASYHALEALDARAAAEDDPRGFLLHGEADLMIVDEVQRVPSLFSYLQEIADEPAVKRKYVLSGSQNYLLLESVSQSLAGRVALLFLYPFTMTELAPHFPLPEEPDALMLAGSYPPVYDRRIPAGEFFDNYVATYVERDVRAVRGVGDLARFRRFMQLCAGRIGQLLNVHGLANEAGVDHKTAEAWLSVLEAGHVVFRLQPYYRSFSKRVVKQRKLYFFDTGLVAALLGVRDERLLSRSWLRGVLFENLVIAEYAKGVYHRGRRPRIYFWRDHTGNEVDLLVEDGERIAAVEIKGGSTITRDMLKGITTFQRVSGIDPAACYLVCGGRQSVWRPEAHVLSWREVSRLPG